MSEVFWIGLLWGIIGTLLVQSATVGLLRLRRRSAEPAGERGPSRARRGRDTDFAPDDGIERMQQRIAVLEQITTDSGFRTARAIDGLR